MPRALEFDYDTAIDRATRLFWKHGYTDTSLRDLLKVMEIGEGSFYNTLKSKKRLYLECLKHYSDTVGRRRDAELSAAPSARAGIRAFFAAVLDDLDHPGFPRACLIAESVSPDVLAEPDLRKWIRREVAGLIERFAKKLRSARDCGELPAEFDPDIAARIIGTYLQGMFRSVLLSYDRTHLERQIDGFLTGLGL